ncbi:MAG TPA: prepilin-type N-terminal cleavage/methylation domain-containing protein [Blastocatellia bacterium]|nr:prepilin-type N-terminal cleavage/methylation domain-containing protein [Blastocatellia bacterium]
MTGQEAYTRSAEMEIRKPAGPDADRFAAASERGFSLVELMIAMMVFTLIMGSVVGLLVKSQKIFRTEQGVSEMDQNARLMIDFLTRDIQQSKENALGLGQNFRSIYSYNGPEGKTDEVTIISSDTETKIPSAALPLTAATTRPFSALDHYVEILPNGHSNLEIGDVHANLKANEEFIISATLQDGSTQFDFVKVTGARVTPEGTLGLSFNPVEHKGVQPEIPYGSVYEDGVFTLRPVSIKRYFIDRENDKHHPHFALSVNGGEPISISRNVVAFQLRYLEQKQGEVEGQWVKEQSIARGYRTLAVEVTMTARTEIKGDTEAERLVTLASVVRPRYLPGDGFGSSGGSRNPGFPGGGGGDGEGWDDGSGDGGNGGDGPGGGPGGNGRGPGDSGFGGSGGPGGGGGLGSGSGSDDSFGFGSGGYRHETRRIGRNPKLGQRLRP